MSLEEPGGLSSSASSAVRASPETVEGVGVALYVQSLGC